MLTDEQAKALIETVQRAFSPLTCAAEIWDRGRKFRFRVFDSAGNPLVAARSIPLDDIRDPRSRNDLLAFARGQVECRGIRLNPFRDR